jgi:tetrahydromethanopterin S-methyltransferase subunit A
MELLFEISKSKDTMDRILIAGRLLTENKGIDAIIRFTIKNPELNYLILCGKEVRGHNAGQAILALHRHGVNDKGIIVRAIGPSPFLNSSQEEIELFRKQVIIFDLIGIDNIQEIKTSLSSMTKDDPTFSKFNYHK